jgi:hypothetical protein
MLLNTFSQFRASGRCNLCLRAHVFLQIWLTYGLNGVFLAFHSCEYGDEEAASLTELSNVTCTA